jgi:hypothetical protein
MCTLPRLAAALLAAALLAPGGLRAQSGPKIPPRVPPAEAPATPPDGHGTAGMVRAGQTVAGTLARADSVMDDATHVDVWTYQGHRGERITVTLASADFDAFLAVARPVDGEYLATGDDTGGGREARVTLDLVADGTYHLLANTLHPGETGRYTLSVRSAPSPAGTLVASDTRRKPRDWAALYPGGGDPRGRYALLVGIASYPRDEDDLEGPADDVRAMQALLVGKYGFDPRNVVVLRNNEGSREQILNAALRHLGQAGPQGLAVFYFSGHGTQVDGDFGPPDEPDGKDEALSVWGPQATTANILDDELAYLSERLPAGRALFILDACHAGVGGGTPPASGAPVTTGGDERTLSGTLGGPGAPRRRILLSASSAGQSSWVAATRWANGGQESVFTHYLVQFLQSAPQPTWGALADEVGRLTVQYARNRFSQPQTPQVDGADRTQRVDVFMGKE